MKFPKLTKRKLAIGIPALLLVAADSAALYAYLNYRAIENEVREEFEKTRSAVDDVIKSAGDVPPVESPFTDWERKLRDGIRAQLADFDPSTDHVAAFEATIPKAFTFNSSRYNEENSQLPVDDRDVLGFEYFGRHLYDERDLQALSRRFSPDWLREMLVFTQPCADAWQQLCASGLEHFDEIERTKLTQYALPSFPYERTARLMNSRLCVYLVLQDYAAFNREFPIALRGLTALSGGQRAFRPFPAHLTLGECFRTSFTLFEFALERGGADEHSIALMESMDTDFSADQLLYAREDALETMREIREVVDAADGLTHLIQLFSARRKLSETPFGDEPDLDQVGVSRFEVFKAALLEPENLRAVISDTSGLYTVAAGQYVLPDVWPDVAKPDKEAIADALRAKLGETLRANVDAWSNSSFHWMAASPLLDLMQFHKADRALARTQRVIVAYRALQRGDDPAAIVERINADANPMLPLPLRARVHGETIEIVHLNEGDEVLSEYDLFNIDEVPASDDPWRVILTLP